MTSKMDLNPEKPTTQTLDSVRELLVYLKRPVDPLPVFIELKGNVRLTKSQKGDCYYTSSLSECSCKARTFNPARPCKHMVVLRLAYEEKIVRDNEPLIQRGGFKPFDLMPDEKRAGVKA
jgi:hypothetical protein